MIAERSNKAWVFEEGTRFAISLSGNVLYMFNKDHTKWHYCLKDGVGSDEIPKTFNAGTKYIIISKEDVNKLFPGYLQHLRDTL